jgi:hypothetical protein
MVPPTLELFQVDLRISALSVLYVFSIICFGFLIKSDKILIKLVDQVFNDLINPI